MGLLRTPAPPSAPNPAASLMPFGLPMLNPQLMMQLLQLQNPQAVQMQAAVVAVAGQQHSLQQLLLQHALQQQQPHQ
jgi:hypothetical protein